MTITINDLAVTLATERLALAVSLRSGVWTARVTFGGHPLDGCFTASAEAESLDEAVAGAIEEWRAFRADYEREEAEEREPDEYDGIDPDVLWNSRGDWDSDDRCAEPVDDEGDTGDEPFMEDACF